MVDWRSLSIHARDVTERNVIVRAMTEDEATEPGLRGFVATDGVRFVIALAAIPTLGALARAFYHECAHIIYDAPQIGSLAAPLAAVPGSPEFTFDDAMMESRAWRFADDFLARTPRPQLARLFYICRLGRGTGA